MGILICLVPFLTYQKAIDQKQTYLGSKVWRNPRLGIEEVNIPEPGPGEVLIEVKTCGICGSDVWPSLTLTAISGIPACSTPLCISGNDQYAGSHVCQIAFAEQPETVFCKHGGGEIIMDGKVVLGIIGVGRIGRLHAENIVNHVKNAHIRAVSDIYADKARDWAKPLGDRAGSQTIAARGAGG